MGLNALIWLRGDGTHDLGEVEKIEESRAKHDASNHDTQPLEVFSRFYGSRVMNGTSNYHR
jgi:hypothetical protein